MSEVERVRLADGASYVKRKGKLYIGSAIDTGDLKLRHVDAGQVSMALLSMSLNFVT
jgi:hypothetical protein